MVLDGVSDFGDEGTSAELFYGDVDGDADHVQALVLPSSEGSAGLVEHPVSDGCDESALFGSVDEAPWEEEAALGVVPADECFGGEQGARGEVDLGLVVKLELVVVERFTEFLGQLGPLPEKPVEIMCESRVTDDGVLGDAVESHFCLSHEFRCRALVGRQVGHADVERDRDGHVFDEIGRGGAHLVHPCTGWHRGACPADHRRG